MSLKKFLPLIALVLASSALAVGTSHWTHTTEADFKAGTFDNVVATNLGDLKLSRATHNLLEEDSRISAVHALAEAKDGTIYAATGPQGVLLKIRDDKIETAATLGDNINLFSLLIDDTGRLLIGTGGAKGQIFRIEKTGDKPVEIFSDDDVQYVWSLARSSDGNIYAATGPNGKLFEIHPDGSKKILFQCDENNLLSMVSDGKDLLYVGSDPSGHIYRINRKTGESFVVFDAPESEVSALTMDGHGNLYAGTGQSSGEDTAEAPEPAGEKSGRPEMDQPQPTPIPGEPPKNPEPPKLPLPGPGEPPAIPKDSGKESAAGEPKKLSIQPEQDPVEIPAPTKPGKPRKSPTIGVPPQRPPVTAQRGGQPAPGGNAVYKIDADGFVTEIFRQDVLVLSLHENNGILLVGTGGEGAIYQINPAAEETSVIARLDPKAVLALLPTKSGKLIVGTANDGQVLSMSSGFATHGTFTSAVLDATQISRFGKIHLRGTLPKETTLSIATRSGNVSATSDTGWSKWSEEIPAAEYLKVTSAPARFLQYRITMTSAASASSPVVDEVSVAYQMPNLAPELKSLKVAGAEGSGALVLTWEAADPNGDALVHTIYFRRVSDANWILLKEKQVEPTFDWNTKSVADGSYEVKVVTSDAQSNPMNEGKSASRVSDPVEIDNTPPVIGDLTVKPQEQAVKVDARLIDRTSTVAKLEYSVDSSVDWQSVLPVDKIADSPDESYEFLVGGLSAGAHQIMLRATDAHGNQSFESSSVTIK